NPGGSPGERPCPDVRLERRAGWGATRAAIQRHCLVRRCGHGINPFAGTAASAIHFGRPRQTEEPAPGPTPFASGGIPSPGCADIEAQHGPTAAQQCAQSPAGEWLNRWFRKLELGWALDRTTMIPCRWGTSVFIGGVF